MLAVFAPFSRYHGAVSPRWNTPMEVNMQRPTSASAIHHIARRTLLLFTLLCANLQSGCVVREIRDEMVVSNQSISDTNELLRGIREDIDKTNAILDSLGQRLDRNMQQLEKLNTIDVSLTAIDAHLASLRKTLENIDSTIPLLSFADSSEDEATTQPTTQPATQPSTQPATSPAPSSSP